MRCDATYAFGFPNLGNFDPSGFACCTGSDSRFDLSRLICCVISSTYKDSISFRTNFGISFLFCGTGIKGVSCGPVGIYISDRTLCISCSLSCRASSSLLMAAACSSVFSSCIALYRSWCSNFLMPRICWNRSYSCSLLRTSLPSIAVVGRCPGRRASSSATGMFDNSCNCWKRILKEETHLSWWSRISTSTKLLRSPCSAHQSRATFVSASQFDVWERKGWELEKFSFMAPSGGGSSTFAFLMCSPREQYKVSKNNENHVQQGEYVAPISH